MQMVIDIPEGMLDELQTCKFPIQDAYRLCAIIENGTPLPKGHGRLKDVDALKTSYGLECATKYGNESKEQLENSYSTMMLYEIADMLDYAPTIIEADKEGAEE